MPLILSVAGNGWVFTTWKRAPSQRGSVCIYDRAHSAIQQARPEEFDWDSIFEDAVWFHFTGITPALGENLVEICLQACQAAQGARCQNLL